MSYQPLTTQQVFDNALFGLRKQGVRSSKSWSSSTCAYRNDVGHACGIGFSIPDADLARRMDECTVSGITTLLDNDKLPELQVLFGGVDPNLLYMIQATHDRLMPRRLFGDERDAQAMSEWEASMQTVADLHGLTYTPPEAA